MNDFISKIWNGQISPVEDWMKPTEEIKNIERLRATHIEHLTKFLSENEKEILEKLIDCDNEIEWIHNEQAFFCGIRFALNFMLGAV